MTSQMQSNITELVVCLDRSGSMASTKESAQRGFDGFILEQKAQPGECFVSLYQFDDIYESVYVGKAIGAVPNLSLVPRGWTALFDAMARTIQNALTNIKDVSRKVVIIFITDGGENSSREFKATNVSQLVSQARERGWQILFIGSDEAAIAAARNAGVPQSAILYSANNTVGTESAYGSASSNLRSFRSGASATMDWSAEDRKKQDEARKGDA